MNPKIRSQTRTGNYKTAVAVLAALPRGECMTQ